MRPGHHADVCISRENHSQAEDQARAQLDARALPKMSWNKLGVLANIVFAGASILSFLPFHTATTTTSSGNGKRFSDTPEIRALFAE